MQQRIPARRCTSIDDGGDPAWAAPAAAARRVGDRLRRPMDERKRRRARSRAAGRAGPAGRGGRAGQSAHRRRARDGGSRADALARPRRRRARGLVSRPEGRRRDRRGPVGRGESVGAVARHFPRSRRRNCRIRKFRRSEGAPQGPVGRGGHYGAIFAADYFEGAEVGYKWFAAKGERRCFRSASASPTPSSALDGLAVSVQAAGWSPASRSATTGAARASRRRNSMSRTAPGATDSLRLAGWSRVALKPGEGRRVERRRSIRGCSPRSTKKGVAGASRAEAIASRRASTRSDGTWLRRISVSAAQLPP